MGNIRVNTDALVCGREAILALVIIHKRAVRQVDCMALAGEDKVVVSSITSDDLPMKMNAWAPHMLKMKSLGFFISAMNSTNSCTPA